MHIFNVMSTTMKKCLFALTILISTTLPSLAQKAFDEFYIDKTFEKFNDFDKKALSNSTPTTHIQIKPDKIINQVRQSIFGQNAAGFHGNLNTNALREQNWKNGGFSILRFPGGNGSNQFFWDGILPNTIQTESVLKGDNNNLIKGNIGWMLETSEFPNLLTFMDAKGIVCVNVGYAFYGTSADPIETAAQYAADWVKHYNIERNLNIKYWELGNENYGPWQAGFDLGSPEKYGEVCLKFIEKMKAVDSTIQIGVNFFEGDGGFNKPQGKDWNEKVFPIVQDVMDFAIVHHYPHPNTNRNDITESEIYKAVDEVDKTLEWFHRQTETYTNKPAGYYPIAITEYNARTGVREISRTNALFTTLMLGKYASHNDYAAAMQWDLQNGYTESLGDHGATANNDPFLPKGSPNPSFYAHFYMQRYFGDHVIESTSDNPDVVVFPTTFSSGEMGLILVNTSATTQTIEIDLGNFPIGERMYWHTINGDESDFDRTIYINNQGPSNRFNLGQTYTSGTRTEIATAFDTNGVGGPENYASILPFSSVIPPNTAPKFQTDRFSVSYIIFEKSNSGCSAPFLGKDSSFCTVSTFVLSTGLDSTNKTFQWFKDGNDFGTNPELSINSSGTYSVIVTEGECIESDEIIIHEKSKMITIDTVCNPSEKIVLNTPKEGVFHWFESIESTESFFVGNNYETTISETSVFYLEEQIPEMLNFGKKLMVLFSEIQGLVFMITETELLFLL